MALDTTKPLVLDQAQVAAYNPNRKLTKVDFEGSHTFWLQAPTRTVLEAVSETRQKKGLTAANDLAFNSVVVAGPVEACVEDDELFFAVIEEGMGLFEPKKRITTK